jgi:hypothetical protein
VFGQTVWEWCDRTSDELAAAIHRLEERALAKREINLHHYGALVALFGLVTATQAMARTLCEAENLGSNGGGR